MLCPYCNHSDSRVTDSRDTPDGVRRRRECLRCGLRFTTLERIQSTALLVIKRDGRREEFNRHKLIQSLRVACAKRPLPIGAIEKVVDDIESELQKLGRAEVPTSVIGEMVMARLHRLDRVAYIRFASVYRDFADIGSFKEAVEALEQTGSRVPANQPPLFPIETARAAAPAVRRRGRPPKLARLIDDQPTQP